ncbi:MAG TPA: hypothetical protein PK280_09225 [Planctomycetota bacterium]|nr:hypothetical protein [Planctomycetota bacterium]
MTDPVQAEPSAPTPTQPQPPVQEGNGRNRFGFPLACVTAICLVLAATVLQNLWENLVPLWGEVRQGTGLLPLLALCAAALLVALVIVVLLLRRIRRLLTSLRMAAAALLTLVLMLGASRLPMPDERGGAASHADDSDDSGGQRRVLGDRLAVVLRTAHLHEPGGSWGVISLLGLLAAGSAAGILWRRPLGSREFGFLAMHLGILTVLGGLAAGKVFGQSMEVRLVPGATPTPVPPRSGEEPDFRLGMLRAVTAARAPVIQLFAGPADGADQKVLPIDVARGGRCSWRGADIAVLEFLESAVPEMYTENVPGRGATAAVRVSLTGPQGSRECLIPAGDLLIGPAAPLGVALTYEKKITPQDAEAACRRREELDPDRLEVVEADGNARYQAQIPAGRAGVGAEFVLGNANLKVVRRLHVRRGTMEEAARSAGTVPALELAPGGPGPAGRATFRVSAGDQPAQPDGRVPPELAGMQLRYTPNIVPSGARLVEGPAGTFRLVELDEGWPGAVATLAMGGEATLPGGIRFKLLEFIPEARTSYRPAAAGAPGARIFARPAVHVEVRSAGAPPQNFWLFPGLDGRREIPGGAALTARAIDRGLSQAAATVEIIGRRGSRSEHFLARGQPLHVDGWQITLRNLEGAQAVGPVPAFKADVRISRDPAIWAVYVGMLLLALGAPWLLWTRLRRIPETTIRED